MATDGGGYSVGDATCYRGWLACEKQAVLAGQTLGAFSLSIYEFADYQLEPEAWLRPVA
jgi:hypothetical protein